MKFYHNIKNPYLKDILDTPRIKPLQEVKIPKFDHFGCYSNNHDFDPNVIYLHDRNGVMLRS